MQMYTLINKLPIKFEALKALGNSIRGAGKGINDSTAKELFKIAKNGLSDKLPLIKSVSADVFFIDLADGKHI